MALPDISPLGTNRVGADAIAIAASAGELDHLQREHLDLRNKHAASHGAATAAAAAKEAIGLEPPIRDKLHHFRLSTPLPGHCALCCPSGV